MLRKYDFYDIMNFTKCTKISVNISVDNVHVQKITLKLWIKFQAVFDILL